jgi:murein L,D-transpeptidase YafK
LIDQHQLGFAFPVQGMLMKHYRANPAPEWWEKLKQSYTQAMIELYRSHDAAHPRSRQLLFYWAKRSEYVLEYLSCVQSLRKAAIAKKSGDKDSAMEHLEMAMEQLYNAIDTLSDIARDPSDRGLIAVLNTYAYRPLVLEYEAMLSEE